MGLRKFFSIVPLMITVFATISFLWASSAWAGDMMNLSVSSAADVFNGAASLPQTGDTPWLWIVLGIAIVAAIGTIIAFVVYRKKKADAEFEAKMQNRRH